MKVSTPDFEKLVEDIAARLRCACDDLPADEFHALVVKIAETKRKYILRENAEAVLGLAWQEAMSGPHLARRLGSIPRARHFSSLPPTKSPPPDDPPTATP